ncbi:MAG: hypothetical protein AAFW65_04750 [Pseudomonadota bacterium]
MIRLCLAGVLLAGCALAPVPDTPSIKAGPPALEAAQIMPASFETEPGLTGAEIIARAHEAAGGESWVRPGRLKLTGYNIIYRPEGTVMWDRYAMWRVFGDEKRDAHVASGKVRIEAWTGDDLAMLIAFDGAATSNQDGPMEDQSANAMWSNNFGFGAIRNALDEGWTQTRKQDRLIDGAPAHMVALSDPSGGETLFGIRQNDAAILYVGFDTPRGWHERRYSHFYTKPGIGWVQPGRVRLFYDGVKANEAVWTDFDLTGEFDDALFTITEAPTAPTF